MIRRLGQPKKVMSPGVPGGMGSEQFDRRIIDYKIYHYINEISIL